MKEIELVVDKKYELLKDDYIKVGERTVYRIRALKDFGNVKKGDLGGYIAKEENLSHDRNAWVFDNAVVVGEEAVVYDDAEIHDNVRVYDRAKVYHDARVEGGSTIIGGSVRVSSFCEIGGSTTVGGDIELTSEFDIFTFQNPYSGNIFTWVEPSDKIYKKNFKDFLSNKVDSSITIDQLREGEKEGSTYPNKAVKVFDLYVKMIKDIKKIKNE